MSEVDLKRILLDAREDERKAEATYAAVRQVFQNLLDASRNKHLPPSWRSLAREKEGGGRGRGGGRRRMVPAKSGDSCHG